MLANKMATLLRGSMGVNISSCNLIRKVQLRGFCTSSGNLISDMNEIKEANHYFEQKIMTQAIQYYEKSLTILPFYLKGNDSYNQQFENVVSTLIKCYAWTRELGKIESLNKRIIEESGKVQVEMGEKVKEVNDVLSIIGKTSSSLHVSRNQPIKDNYRLITEGSKEKNIPKQLIQLHKTDQPNSENLQPFIHNELRSSTAYIITSLLLQPSLPSNPLYNKLCNTLLKNAQKSSQKNIIKPLIILITNLLRNKQFLQAEGMIQYCLDRKKENIKPNLLKINQQYVLLNVFLGFSFQGVDRLDQSKRLRDQYDSSFKLETYLLQHFLIDSI